ncbi:1-acyl-sn-glycerol-3-phosphate acyltransferase [Metapseudomonas lalkuanensis]|uniref:1-acyl-sn-glycerol-3-phosphate acyltransferase n=1 Tax=Metapseudomonas lalkuanensis TaxID=2604832 RepID=A0A5J6QQD4_9GAMM|nr:lysophospholipid acyltransferase family protein [Pseudomonas lalkuanensis]QEY64714.1 1-acyl-sn-glycerol-3-phosphate acyltransferase [Pseudomonas lalkuanensis]
MHKSVRFYARVARLLAVIGLGLSLALWVGVLERLGRRDLMATRQRLTRWFLARLAGALPFRVQVTGRVPEQPMLWVSNHVSWTDIPLLGAVAPLSFLSKAEVRAWPVAGWLAHKAGTLFIRRGSGDSGLVGQQLARHLGDGRHLLIFPEGTTTDGSLLKTFHSRLLTSAVETQVPVQPVAIRYWRDGQRDEIAPFIGEDDLLSHLLRLLRSDLAEVEIRLLEPVTSQGLTRTELSRKAKSAVQLALFGEVEDEALAA